MTSSHCATSRPFTVVLCTSCTAKPGLGVLEELRATVRRCGHGVLITTECMLGALACAARPHGPAAMVILQPCSVDRRPSGPAHWIGPINDTNDIRAVRDWLQRGQWDDHMLPERLCAQRHPTQRYIRRN
ncbi:MAG TPA: hypothetical protein VMU34_17025 [Mycobacterium sp.]|nr:hypothetical protein [Mycobacterium sp.]